MWSWFDRLGGTVGADEVGKVLAQRPAERHVQDLVATDNREQRLVEGDRGLHERQIEGVVLGGTPNTFGCTVVAP